MYKQALYKVLETIEVDVIILYGQLMQVDNTEYVVKSIPCRHDKWQDALAVRKWQSFKLMTEV